MYNTSGRRKYYLKVHIIFVSKYRYKIFDDRVGSFLKKVIVNLSIRYKKFSIDIMETDRDHIHMLISYTPEISITSLVRRLKQSTTKELWKTFPYTLSRYYKKRKILWSSGYFCCSIGEVSSETIKHYIENQG